MTFTTNFQFFKIFLREVPIRQETVMILKLMAISLFFALFLSHGLNSVITGNCTDRNDDTFGVLYNIIPHSEQITLGIQ